MTAPQDHDAALLRDGGLAAVVIRNKEKILGLFCERANQALKGARSASHPVLIDTLPAFITRVALALRGADYLEFASQYTNIALQHGNERARFTSYTLAEVLREYQFLREILMEVLREHGDPRPEQWKVIHRSVDEGMAEAATAFVQVHDSFREMFTAALTHDFRGPLSSASNYLELVRREQDAQRREQFAVRARQNLQRIARMIAGLLDASRSNAGQRLAIHAESCDVAELVYDTVNDLDIRARQRVITDTRHAIEAWWDAEKVRRALYNLVENAIKYSADGSTVTVRTVATHGRVQLSVHNDGDPIPADDHEALFLPFHRTRQAQRSGKSGWGLGLFQVQAIAEAHGGVVNVESGVESGTVFTLDLVRDVRVLEQAAGHAH